LDRKQVGLKKIDEEKTRRVDPATRSKTRLQLVNFFLLKRHHFDFYFKKNGRGDLVKTQNLALNRIKSKNYAIYAKNTNPSFIFFHNLF
jgi:hypothetical protein